MQVYVYMYCVSAGCDAYHHGMTGEGRVQTFSSSTHEKLLFSSHRPHHRQRVAQTEGSSQLALGPFNKSPERNQVSISGLGP